MVRSQNTLFEVFSVLSLGGDPEGGTFRAAGQWLVKSKTFFFPWMHKGLRGSQSELKRSFPVATFPVFENREGWGSQLS
jgi:hypothetical protein